MACTNAFHIPFQFISKHVVPVAGASMTDPIGEEFHKRTKYLRGKLPGHRLDWTSKPSVYKEFPNADSIALPVPQSAEGPGIWDVIRTRRSVRAYKNEDISLEHLSQMLWATQGITARAHDYELRASPSAGALYPIETYLCINRVAGLDPGLYHYDVRTHALDVIKKGDYGDSVMKGALDQMIAKRAAVVFIWSAIINRSRWKYLQRAYRYVFLDAGHIAQNLALAAQALGLGSCQIGAIYDDELNSLLGLDGIEESVIYLGSVGAPIRQ
ncbi:MAG: SagB/ThcOx family dehydrogenase [Candidatus Thorarchaeota archaeon]|nr:SagB/ThcOx family dehydrogenase [Candidatus Thorarchaeota archaeon]